MWAKNSGPIDIFSAEELILELLQKKPSEPVFVAIDGEIGAGKSYFANLMHEKHCLSVVHTDDFYKPGFDPKKPPVFDGNIDFERLCREVFFQTSDIFSYGVFDCFVQTNVCQRMIDARKPIIIEGTYSLHPRISQRYSLKLFFETAEDVRDNRISARGPDAEKRLTNIWIPASKRYFEHYKIKERCHAVVKT